MKVVVLSPDLGEDRVARSEARLRSKADVLGVPGGSTVEEFLPRADAYLCVGFPREFPEAPEAYARLRLIQATLAGVDHLPFERIPATVTVCANAGAYNTSLAEHALALLLAAAKRVVLHAANVRSETFSQDVRSKQLRGATLGVVGLGGIGREVARLGRALGMRVVGVTRRGRSDFPAEFVGGPGDLGRVLDESDFVVIAVPHTRETHHLITARELGRMKSDAVLVNVARGDIVEEDDLFEHLRAVPSFHAASDVWWRYPRGRGFPYTRPFHELPNFFGTPHVAWNVPPQRMASLDAALDNVEAWLNGRPLRNVVDPSVYR